MSRQIVDTEILEGEMFDDGRITSVKKVNDFANIVEHYYPDGFIFFCEEDQNYYRYDKFMDPAIVDEHLGKCRKIDGIIYTNAVLELDANGRDKVPTGWDVRGKKGAIFVFIKNIFEYSYREDQKLPVELYKFFKLTDAASTLTPNPWTLDATGITAVRVGSYTDSESNLIVPEGTVYHVKDSASSIFVIDETGVTINGGTKILWDKVTEKQINKWLNTDSYIEKKTLVSTELLDATARATYIYRNSDTGKFGYFASLTPGKTSKVYSWSSSETTGATILNSGIYGELKEMGGIEEDSTVKFEDLTDDYAIVLKTSLGPKYDVKAKIAETTIDSFWIYDDAWIKLFPLDKFLDEDSLTGVTNRAVTKGINRAGHRVTASYDKEKQILTISLWDKVQMERPLSQVEVGLGDLDVQGPKVDLSFANDLFKAGTVPEDVIATILAEKNNYDIEEVSLVDEAGTVLKTWDSSTDFSQPLTFTFNATAAGVDTAVLDKSHKYHATILDVKGNTGESEVVLVDFVNPCLFNQLGGNDKDSDFVEILSRTGVEEVKFNFAYDRAIYLVPDEKVEGVDVYKDAKAIIGGETENFMLEDHTKAFAKLPFVDGEGVTLWKVKATATAYSFEKESAELIAGLHKKVLFDGLDEAGWNGIKGIFKKVDDDGEVVVHISAGSFVSVELIGSTTVIGDEDIQYILNPNYVLCKEAKLDTDMGTTGVVKVEYSVDKLALARVWEAVTDSTNGILEAATDKTDAEIVKFDSGVVMEFFEMPTAEPVSGTTVEYKGYILINPVHLPDYSFKFVQSVKDLI